MKQRKLKEQPYQLLDHDDEWKSSDAANFTPWLYLKPARRLALPNGALLALMVGLAADEWLIYSVDDKGIPARSSIFEERAMGELMFVDVIARFTEREKGALVAKMEKLPAKKRAEAALELARLEVADDEEYGEIKRQVGELVAARTPLELEELFQLELAEYDRARAAGDADDFTLALPTARDE